MTKLASKRYLWFAISLAVILPGLVSLLLFGVRLGIDFTGGTAWEVAFQQSTSGEAIQKVLEGEGYAGSTVQKLGVGEGDSTYLIRLKEVREGSPEKAKLASALTRRISPFIEREFSTVGASVGQAIRNRAFIAVLFASVGILLYIAYAFRNTQNPMLYGICALVAMLHDVLVVLGIFSILGEVAHIEVGSLFVTALLTVIGFSVHDTIVVFDRIRENLARRVDADFEEVVNYSLAQTIVRSMNTSLTVIFTLLALYLFGGTTTREFVLALLIGVVSGTYSSVFNASQLLVAWEKGEIQRLFGRIRGRGRPAGPATMATR